MKEIKKVAIVGLGALGMLYGTHIIRHRGQDAVSYVMDADRLARYKDAVYTVNGEVVDLPKVSKEEVGIADLVMVAVKYTGLSSAYDLIRACVGPETIVMSVMNGISSEELIAEQLPPCHMIYTVPQGMDAMRFGSDLRYTQMGKLHIGVPEGGDQEALESVKAFFDDIEMPYQPEEDILWRMWFKYMLNVGVNQVCMMCDTTYAGVTNPGEPHDMLMRAMDEVRLVANAKGIHLTKEDMETCVEIERTLDPMGTPSMGQDRINKKASEVEMFAGTMIRMGEELGIPTPMNAYIYQRVHEIESEYVTE